MWFTTLEAIPTILAIAFAEVVAPIPGSFAVLSSLTLFGWEKTLIYSYFGLLLASIVNFWLSRIFGRELILKISGKKSFEKIDMFTAKEGKTALVLARTLGYPFSDFVSYAAGLTNISFKSYFIISSIGLALSNFVFLLIFKHLNFDAPQDFFIWFAVAGLLVLAGSISMKFFYKGE